MAMINLIQNAARTFYSLKYKKTCVQAYGYLLWDGYMLSTNVFKFGVNVRKSIANIRNFIHL